MFFVKYLVFALAIISTGLFINSMVSSIVAGPSVLFNVEEQKDDPTLKSAGLRVILILIMGITWPLVFLLG